MKSGSKPKNSSTKVEIEPSMKSTMKDDFEEFPSSDEEDNEESDESFDGFASSDEDEEGGANKAQVAEKVDESKIKQKINEMQTKRQNSGKANEKEKPGVVYVGRIPHGFYEDQMKNYFSQFGNINRLRLSRNKKTGKSKHYGFVEFESGEVARIVADTMDNYLLFGHILKVKLMPPQNVHEDLFAGSNRTFKAVPWKRIAKQRHDRQKPLEQLQKLQEKESKRRSSKEDKLKKLGIEYSISEPTVLKAKVAKGQKVAKSKKAQKRSK
jgi:nucleolar protein 15